MNHFFTEVGLGNLATSITAGDRSGAFSLDSRRDGDAIHIACSEFRHSV